MTEEQKSWYEINRELGEALGYPECCIRAFGLDAPGVMDKMTKRQWQIANLRYKMGHIDGKFTGFIPCGKHAARIYFRLTSLKKLIKNRSPLFPEFPCYANENFKEHE